HRQRNAFHDRVCRRAPPPQHHHHLYVARADAERGEPVAGCVLALSRDRDRTAELQRPGLRLLHHHRRRRRSRGRPCDHRRALSRPANDPRGRYQQPEVLARESREWTRMKEIVFKDESYAIIGACFEVYNEKGCGFLEPVYQECLQIEFEHQRIPAMAKPALTLSYRAPPSCKPTRRTSFATAKSLSS